MKTLNNFLAIENEVYVLTNSELISVKGGDTPPQKPSDPFDELPPIGTGNGRSQFATSFITNRRR